MKHLILIFVGLLSSTSVDAQKHKLFTDVGISGSQLLPGLSATYNYNPLKFLGIGAGVHVHHFFPTVADKPRYVPALFGDLRFTVFPRKKNQILAFLDVGMNFYKKAAAHKHENTIIHTDESTSGIHTGIGLGYLRVLKEEGLSMYWTLKTLANSAEYSSLDLTTKQYATSSGSRSTIVLSFGYRF